MLELSGQSQDQWRMGHAGDTLNTLWTLRALLGADDRLDYVSAFGDDPFSTAQIAFFQDHGIGIAESPVIAGARPGLYAITLDGAERSFTYWRADAAARQLAASPDRLTNSLSGRDLVYFSGITLGILSAEHRATLLSAISKARSTGAMVAFDPNYRPRLWPDAQTARQAVTEALAVCDIALPTFPDEQTLFGDAAPAETAQRLSAAGVREVVVKNGDSAAHLLHDGRTSVIPGLRVDTAVDTTGAGDSFNGAYIAARLLGHEPEEAVARGHRVAAAVIQVRGALAPFQRIAEAFAG
jgi:2-dehydro-3-deoxygluconokinase